MKSTRITPAKKGAIPLNRGRKSFVILSGSDLELPAAPVELLCVLEQDTH